MHLYELQHGFMLVVTVHFVMRHFRFGDARVKFSYNLHLSIQFFRDNATLKEELGKLVFVFFFYYGKSPLINKHLKQLLHLHSFWCGL